MLNYAFEILQYEVQLSCKTSFILVRMQSINLIFFPDVSFLFFPIYHLCHVLWSQEFVHLIPTTFHGDLTSKRVNTTLPVSNVSTKDQHNASTIIVITQVPFHVYSLSVPFHVYSFVFFSCACCRMRNWKVTGILVLLVIGRMMCLCCVCNACEIDGFFTSLSRTN